MVLPGEGRQMSICKPISLLPPIQTGKNSLSTPNIKMARSSRFFVQPQSESPDRAAETAEVSQGTEKEVSAEIGQGIEKDMTNMKLRKLQDIFEEADEDGGGGLDMDEFRNAMRKAMGDHLTDHELDLTFMKVDTNCDGTVDWDEYLSYMLLEYREKDRMNFIMAARPFPKEMRLVSNLQKYQRNHDIITQIAFMPNLSKMDTGLYQPLNDGSGRYITATKDGIINFWNLQLKHLKTHIVEPKQGISKKLGVWVTDLVCLPNLNLLAISTTSCTITFYDLTVGKFLPMRQITELEICATCMDYWYDPEGKSALLLWGDARGNVCAVEFTSFAFLQPKLCKEYKPYVSFSKLLQGEESSIKAYKLERIHDDFTLQVRYIPALDSFLSCSKSGETSLFKGDLQQKKATYFTIRDGILSFDYCYKLNTIVSGGKDAIVRVWNPYVCKKPVTLLQGHKTAVIFVKVNELLEHVVSISEDKEINVFDLNTQTCIQTIFRKWVPLGRRQISAAFCFEPRQALLLASNRLGIFEHQVPTSQAQQLVLQSHSKAVNVVLYNPVFNQVVSGGADSKVNVWDITTGERIMQFTAHTMSKKVGKQVDAEVTAMTFDPTKRRLLTAGQDGTLKIWNFNNGALLRQLETFDQKELTGVLWHNQRIFATGWNRQIHMYVDSAEDNTVMVWGKQHKEDIHALAYLSPGTVASASYNGDILIWSVETAHVMNKFNASESARPGFQKVSFAHLYDCRKDSLHSAKPQTGTETSTAVGTENNQLQGNDRETYSTKEGHKKLKDHTIDGPQARSSTSVSSEETFEMDRSPEACVEKLIFLDCRQTQAGAANLVSVEANGWIRFWSIHPNGGLEGQFNAAHVPGRGVNSVATDPQNFFLFTGDTDGYLKTWDISNYCVADDYILSEDEQMEKEKLLSDFPMIDSFERLREKANTKQDLFDSPPRCTQPRRTWKVPPLLNSFRAHLQSIFCIEYISEHKALLTCGPDCSVRMWSLHGKFIGIFNHNVPWNKPPEVQTKKAACSESTNRIRLGQILKKQLAEERLPPDVRRVASATTFRVFYGKHRSSWRWAKNIVLLLIPLLRATNKPYKPLQPLEPGEGQPDEVETKTPLTLEEVNKELKNKRVSKGRPSSGRSAKGKKKSMILGGSVTIDRKHHPLPQLKKIRQFHHQCDAYSSLPFHELDAVPSALDLKPPQCVLDLRARQKLINPFKSGGKRVRTLVRMGRGSIMTPHKI